MPWIRFFFWFLWQWCPYNLWTNFRNSVHSVFSKLVYNKEKFLQIQMMIYSHISWENAMVLLLQMPDDNWFYCYLNGKRAITKAIYLKYYNKICLGCSLFWRIKIKIMYTLKAMYRNSNFVVILSMKVLKKKPSKLRYLNKIAEIFSTALTTQSTQK